MLLVGTKKPFALQQRRYLMKTIPFFFLIFFAAFCSADQKDTMNFYILDEPQNHWGDYGHILMHGMASHTEGLYEGPIELYRTGPFVPTISFPGIGDVVVTDEFKRKLETSDLKGFIFRRVIKKRIVNLEWRKWDLYKENPPIFPGSGEPEDYINERPHSPELANSIGDLWELVIKVSAKVKKVESQDSQTGLTVYLIADTWNGDDIFRADDVRYVYLSSKAKIWLEDNAKGFVSYRDVTLK